MPKPSLSKKEEAALRAVRDMLAGGLIEHEPSPDISWRDGPVQAFVMTMKRLFNMGETAGATECGSVACIGGWMGAMMGMDHEESAEFVMRYEDRGKFKTLFYPPAIYDYALIKPTHAVKAIDNFLANGNPRWAAILPASLKEEA